MFRNRSLADALAPETTEHIRGERPPLWRNRCIFLATLLILPVTLLLIVSLWLFVSFGNQVNAPQLKLNPQTELLNGLRPRPNLLDSLIGSLRTSLALSPTESWPQIRSSQILTKVSDGAKTAAPGLAPPLFYDTLSNRPVQKSLIVWYVYYHCYLDDEAETEA